MAKRYPRPSRAACLGTGRPTRFNQGHRIRFGIRSQESTARHLVPLGHTRDGSRGSAGGPRGFPIPVGDFGAGDIATHPADLDGDGNDDLVTTFLDGDGEFDSSDLVLAFQAGTYSLEALPDLRELAAAVDRLFAKLG